MKQRSFFGPLLLIAVGVIWLLISFQVIPAGNLWAIPQLVPYILMAFGVALLVRSRWATAGQVISLLVLVGAVLVVAYAPQLGWNRAPSWSIGDGFWGSVAGSGQVRTETRQLDSFDSISLRYPGEITIEQGDKESVVIEAEDNVIPQISTDVESGKLIIANREVDWDARVNPTKPVKITITVKDLKEIDFTAAGSLVVDGLETDTLKLVLSGAGQVKLDGVKLGRLETILSGAGDIEAGGTAEEVDIRISGFGSFKGADLQSSSATVHISGAGDATLRVDEDLDATITGAGSVKYYGSPRVKQTISGAGSVEQVK